MKRDSRDQYVAAMVSHARRKTVGAAQPVVVNAYRFFDEAADKAGLPHAMNASNTKQIIDMFHDDLANGCCGDDDGLPIIVLKVTRGVIKEASHGRQAVIDENRTPKIYRTAATVSRGNPHEGWALFAPDASKDHPIVRAGLEGEKKRIETSQRNFDSKVEVIASDMRIGISSHEQAKLAV